MEELSPMRNELVETLDSAGLVLSKWATNCELLIDLNQSTDVSAGEHEDTNGFCFLDRIRSLLTKSDVKSRHIIVLSSRS